MLYTLEALSEWMDRDELDKDGRPLPAQATFQGVVWVDEAHEGEMREALSQIRHLGAAISRGLGRVKIETWPIQIRMPSEEQLSETAKELAEGAEPERPEGPLPKEADLTERILAFNRLWACEREAKGLPAAGWYFTVDLQSEALLWRANGPAYLLTSDILGFPPEVELVRAFTAHQQIGGWSTAWGMPKPTMPAVAAGSVFLYQVPGDDVALAHKVLKRLTILEKEGVGERREEGYGWLQVCTPFHLEMEVGK
jgi:CRISPR-associated protein Csx10